MSTATQRRRRFAMRKTATAEQPKARKRRWKLIALAAALMALVALVWLLPVIVAHSPVLGWIVAAAAGDLDGTVEVRSASLGWFSPIVLGEIEVRDRQGEPVLNADGLSGRKWLASILWDRSILGQFQIERPRLTVVLRHDGSNLEDLLAAYLQADRQSKPTEVGLVIVDGSVSVADQHTGQSWQIEDLQLTLSVSAEAAGPLELAGSATVADPQHAGRLSVEMSTADPQTGELKAEAGQVPLAMFRSLLGRFVPQARLAGRLSGDIHALWGAEEAALETDLSVGDLLLAMRPLGTDRVQLERLHVAGRIARRGDRIEISDSTLDCDLASLAVSSVWEGGRQQTGSRLASLLTQTHHVDARVDLARLAAMLPQTLRIRRQTRITSGQVQLAVSSRPEPRGMVWQARLETSDLRAVDRGRQLAWQRPILLTLAAHDFREGPVVDELKCVSDFFKLHASGTPHHVSASASFELERLAERLGQFVDLEGIDFGGNGWAQLNWKHSADGQFTTDAELQLHDLRLAVPQQGPWEEKDLLLSVAASGRTDFGPHTRLQTASLRLKAGADRLHARLTQPVIDFDAGGSWPVEVRGNGDLQPWPGRLRARQAPHDWQLAGDYEVLVRGVGSKDGVTIDRTRIVVSQLQLHSARLNVAEPAIELTASGRWDRDQGQLHLDPATLSCQSFSVRADQVVIAVPEDDPPELSGNLEYRADLQRLWKWISDPKARPACQVQGRLSGTSRLSHSAGTLRGRVEADVAKLAITLPSGKRLSEPLVHLAARGNYQRQAGVLDLQQVCLTSDMLAAEAAGRIAPGEVPTDGQLDGQLDVQLDGQLRYDLEKLSGLLEPYLGPGVRLVGRGRHPAWYRGPLWLAEARAEAALGFESASVYGFPVGPGELKATLADGLVRLRPMDLAVGGGRMRLAPQLRLAPAPVQLIVPQGPLATKLQITPAMCSSALQYVAPVLAGVAKAQGAFSVELEDCRIPLADPAAGAVAGRLIIHSVQVAPGPLVRELAVLLGRESPAALRRESVVPFRMVDGRVHHSGLELVFPELTIRTAGSVGLDRTLDLMAEMPVPPKWLGNNPVGAALRNQKIQLRVTGTLSKPALDRRAIRDLSRRFIERAAQGVIENEVGKQLERLFGPPR